MIVQLKSIHKTSVYLHEFFLQCMNTRDCLCSVRCFATSRRSWRLFLENFRSRGSGSLSATNDVELVVIGSERCVTSACSCRCFKAMREFPRWIRTIISII